MKDGAPETTETTLEVIESEKKIAKEPAQATTAESDDEDFAADTQEMEEAAESESESEDEENKASEDDVVEEDFAVEIKGGHIHKMKFDKMDHDSQDEDVTEATENEAKLEMLSKTLPDQDDEDGDYNPCHDTLSDVEVDDDENDEEATPAIKKLDTLHKRTGAPLTEIEMNTDELKIPPADFVAQVAAGAEEEMEE